MKPIRFVGRARTGFYTGLVLQRIDQGMCITAAADEMSKDEVLDALDMETREPLVCVQADRTPARVLPLWAKRMGSGHLVDLLRKAVLQCPEHVRHTARIVVDDVSYTITRLEDGMRLQSRDADLTLRGGIATRTNGQRWLYLRGLTRPPRSLPWPGTALRVEPPSLN